MLTQKCNDALLFMTCHFALVNDVFQAKIFDINVLAQLVVYVEN